MGVIKGKTMLPMPS